MARKRKAKKSKANVKIDSGLDEFLEAQKRLTEDYLGNPRGKRTKNSCAYTLVRGPKGQLLMVSDKKVTQVKDHCVDEFFDDLNELVRLYLEHIDPRLV